MPPKRNTRSKAPEKVQNDKPEDSPAKKTRSRDVPPAEDELKKKVKQDEKSTTNDLKGSKKSIKKAASQSESEDNSKKNKK